MSRQKKTEIVPVTTGLLEFDYACLKPAQAEKLRNTAKSIRDKINKSLLGLIEAGQSLITAKSILPHGHFGPWLEGEFGWSDRTARKFMAVAEQFGSKTELISDLAITPTAAYLLAAPSAPFEARQKALDRAQSGEKVTPAIVNEILASVRKVSPLKGKKVVPLDRVSRALMITLRRFRDQFGPDRALEYARQLIEFARDLKKGNGNRKSARDKLGK